MEHTHDGVIYHDHGDGHVHSHTIEPEHTHDNEHSHGHEHTHTQTKAVVNRLSRAIGHLESVKRMVEDEHAKCEDVMIQIHAADAALHRIGLVVLEGHLGHCVRKGIKDGRADEAVRHFMDSLNQYVNIK